ncbi:glycosaminoglycan attachment protein [Pseudomonas sp. CFBP 13711]|uniref:glycosaminoglycan attachment protein n=1 Tax=unclassified Pseudomonas TaxID=196821 RepID=UPI001787609A|nr:MULTISPECIES: glycosaminoglycan attachment protein [unclassified Pseudomonas]MBD8707322.1 glycosaminoglycan attachment protein [Pseudomonas sp. CFBP 13711]MBD8711298.1 glycosaminoglycan attachment protein [Pseudomonas sp. CFBP 13715]
MGEAKRRGTKAQRIAALFDESGVVKLTPERYNAFIAWTRSPNAKYIGLELEFFSDQAENLIGVLIQDRSDRDHGFVILGRDVKGRFRGIEVEFGMNKISARHALFTSFRKLIASGKTVFPQGDEHADKAGVELFETNLPEEKLHRAFQVLKHQPHWLPARGIMEEMMRHFVDVDGNFVEQFQTTAFDSRIWELYLYAALLELDLFVNKEHEAPDFEVTDGRAKVFIEAVTVGPSPRDEPPPKPTEDLPLMRSLEEVRELLKTRAPIRFGSALYSKLNRKNKYWDLEHVQGHPLVFAIADFHEDQSMTWSSPALMEYLYAISHDASFDDKNQLVIEPQKIETHEYQGKTIPSGYFFQPGAENVSAVLFSASGTISKFNRMGRLAGFGRADQLIVRWGTKHRHDPNAAIPDPFLVTIEQGAVTETWAEGLSMFHNPNAKHPVDPNMFPGIAHHWFDDGQINSVLPSFHVYNSFTWNLLATDEAAPNVDAFQGAAAAS